MFNLLLRAARGRVFLQYTLFSLLLLDGLLTLVSINTLLVVHHAVPIPRIRRLHMRRNHTAMSPHFFVLKLDEPFRSFLRDCLLIAEDQKRRIANKDTVNVLETSTGGFGVEEVYF